MAFMRLGFAGTKCGSSYPRHRLCAVTCLPPTNCATDARSVSDVATFRSASAGAAVTPPSPSAIAITIKDFMEPPLWNAAFDCSVRMGRVISDRVAELHQDPVVSGVDAGTSLGVAVLEPDERELRRCPREVH